jgi:hypothetical protein
MLKKMVIVTAVLLMASSAYATGLGWSPNKFGNLPATTIKDPADPNKTIPNPAYEALWGTDRTVDWERNSNDHQRKGESWNWPATYDFVPISEIRVRMDIGFWIRLNNCWTNRNLDVKQRTISSYGGQITCAAQTNVATEWKADFKKNDNIDFGGSWKSKAVVDPATLAATGTSTKDLTIKLMLYDIDLKSLPAGTNCLHVGNVVISVRPTVRPNQFMSGCGGSYPQYAPPPIDSGIAWW